jgi:drug/metabolite transporter (DMT)-like permease
MQRGVTAIAGRKTQPARGVPSPMDERALALPPVRWNLSVAGLAASWGLISVIVAGVDLDASVLVFHRLALAAVATAAAAVLLGRAGVLRVPAAPWRLLVVGAVLAAHWFLFFETIKVASVAFAVIVVYTAPILLSLLAPVFLPERRSRIALVALVPALAGVALVAAAGEGELQTGALGIALGVGAAVTYALLVIATKRLTATLAPPTITFWSYVVAAVVLAPAIPAAERVLPRGADLGYVLLLGVVFTALSGVIYVWLLGKVTAQAVGILAYLEPVSAALLAWVILGQPLGPGVLGGAALVVAGGVLVVLAEPADAPAPQAPPGRRPGGREPDDAPEPAP